MKRIIKVSFLCFIIGLSIFLFPVHTNAQNVAGYSIEISDDFEKVEEYNLEFNAKYNKNFWTAWHKGIHEFSTIYKYYGIYQHYDKDDDRLYLLLLNRIDVLFSGDQYGNDKYPYLEQGQYNINIVKQSFGIIGVNCEKFILGNSSPSTKQEYRTIARGLSCGVTIASDGSVQLQFQESIEISKTVDDISFSISGNENRGKTWTYTATTHSNQTQSEFISITSQIYYLDNASNYYNKDFKLVSDGYVEWDLPIKAWEHYRPNTNDGNNDHINLRIEHVYTIPQLS